MEEKKHRGKWIGLVGRNIFPVLGIAMSLTMFSLYSDKIAEATPYLYCATFWVGIFILIVALGFDFDFKTEVEN